MLPFNEALKIWAAERLGHDPNNVISVELYEVEAHTEGMTYDYEVPAHWALRMWMRPPRYIDHDLSGVSMAEISYGVLAVGMRG